MIEAELEDVSDDEILGSGFAAETSEFLADKHFGGAFNVYPVPLAQDLEEHF